MRKFIFLVVGSFFVCGLFLCTSKNAFAASVGDVLINEFMANPDGSDTEGEWIEIINMSGEAINLDGWSINDGANHPISGSYIVPNGGYAVICRNTSTSTNGGVLCNYTASLAMANSGDRNIVLFDDLDQEIDNILYSGDNIESGVSRYYRDGSWFDGLDGGTPGIINTQADVEDGETGTLNGSVELTISDIIASIEQDVATISFMVNDNGTSTIEYGLSDVYGDSVVNYIVSGSNEVVLSELNCNSTYYYKVVMQNAMETVESEDMTFEISCGDIEINSLVMTKASAKANDDYADGWEWNYDITVRNEDEDQMQMKFGSWAYDGNTIDSAGNVRFSIDNGVNWLNIDASDVYSGFVDISDLDMETSGIQVNIIVQVKIPKGTRVGDYSAEYGIRTE